jgi:predicted amidohydrolase
MGYLPYSLPDYLVESADFDLTIFPELFPFIKTGGKTISDPEAIAQLENYAASAPACTFIAGGYVVANTDTRRNRIYLVDRGRVTDFYDKQMPAKYERIVPGLIVKNFSWGDNKCIPLICADAYEEPGTQFMECIVARAIIAGASKHAPIVVCSYSISLMMQCWTRKLHHLADKWNSPLVISA